MSECATCKGTETAWYMQGGPYGIGSWSKCEICDGTGITTEDNDGIHDWCVPERGLHGSQCTVPEAIRAEEHQRGITTEDDK